MSYESDARLPHFYPPSPASPSALQHCSTIEIQLASTSMTGVDGCSESDSRMLNDSFANHGHHVSPEVTAPEFTGNPADREDRPFARTKVLSDRGIKLAKRMRTRDLHDSVTELSRDSSSTGASPDDASRSETLSGSHRTASPPLHLEKDGSRSPSMVTERSQFPEVLSFIVPMEPLPSGTPVTKQLLAAKGIMRDSRTPGSGQSVRFFSRDTYSLALGPDGVSPTKPLSARRSQSKVESEPTLPDLANNSASQRPFTSVNFPGSPLPSRALRSPADESKACPDDSEHAIPLGQASPSMRMDMADAPHINVDLNPPIFDVFCSTSLPARIPDTLPLESRILGSTSVHALSPAQSSFGLSLAHPVRSTTPVESLDNERLQDATPPISQVADPIASGSSPARSSSNAPTLESIRPPLPPPREIITLDDSSDCSTSRDPISPIFRPRLDETIYLTPDTTKSKRKITLPEVTPPLQGAYLSTEQYTSQALTAAETVFSAHKKSLQVLCEERDGWRKLCEDLMASQEAEMASSTLGPQDAPSEYLGRSTRQETDYTVGTLKATPLPRIPASGHPLVERSRSVSSPEAFTVGRNVVLMQDQLQDMQIRMEAKQRESDEERAKAERWEAMYMAQSSALEDLRHDKEKYIRDARDVDVRLELYARERENKVRQQLQAEMQSVLVELHAMHRQCDDLKLALQQQRQDTYQSDSDVGESSRNVEISKDSHRRREDPTALSHPATSTDALDPREEVIQNLRTQLDQAQREQERAVEASELLEATRRDLAKEIERTAELISLLDQQESRLATLQHNLDVERDDRSRESSTLNRRIANLQAAYDDQVKRNHEQYLELEEAMDDREAKFSERITELESACDKKQEEILQLENEANRLKAAETASSALRANLGQMKEALSEREIRIEQIAPSNERQTQQITRQDETIAALKRQAADDVFKSTKQERRIEKLLHDREMLNIAVEQLQIHIQLVKRQYKARTGNSWDDDAQASPSGNSRPSIASKRVDRSISTPLGESKAINYSVERSTTRRQKQPAR